MNVLFATKPTHETVEYSCSASECRYELPVCTPKTYSRKSALLHVSTFIPDKAETLVIDYEFMDSEPEEDMDVE